MVLTRPKPDILRNAKGSLQQELPTLDKASTGHHSLYKEKGAPNLVTIKDFLRFYIAMSHGKIVEKATADSANTRNGSSTEDMHFQRVDYKSAGNSSGSPTALEGLSRFERVDVSGNLAQILVS
jgi:hypothetical protein